jgi:hypothetical protein
VNVRDKGKTGEQEVAEMLASWWTQVEPDAIFKRTPGSGGWGGRGNAEARAGFKLTGDVMTTAKLWPFDVEVKRREMWDYDRFAQGRPSPVWSWWRQTQVSALTAVRLEDPKTEAEMFKDREPMLWFRQNRRPWHVLLRKGFVDSLFRGRSVDTVLGFMCSQCREPVDIGCHCKVPRFGSGHLGSPHIVFNDKLMNTHYGAAWPVCFLGEQLLDVHPLRFVLGSPQAYLEPPKTCPVCGSAVVGVRKQPTKRACSICPWRYSDPDMDLSLW